MKHCAKNALSALAAVGLLLAAQPSQTESPSGSHLATSSEVLTRKLMDSADRYQRANAAQRPEIRQKLLGLVAERHALLLALSEESPEEVGRLVLPGHLRDRLPPEVHNLLEKDVDLTGNLRIVVEDGDGWTRVRHFLETRGTQRSLHFAADPGDLLSGDRVRVRGVLVPSAPGSELAPVVVAYCCDGDGFEHLEAAELPNTFGEQRTAVLLVNFRDDPQEPWTLQQAHDLVFETASAFYLENSSGRTWLGGDVYGWYTLPFDRPTEPATCRSTEVAQGAQQAAAGAGVDLSAFDRYVYVFPHTPCFPSGSATVGGLPSEAWINGNAFTLKTVGHELGHNLGLYHSGALECGDATLGSDCQTFVYGDTMDIMGNQSVGHFNALQKERLGWLDAALGELAWVDAGGSYVLEAYEVPDGSAPKALKVPRTQDPVTGDSSWYYVEYRQPIGFDDFLAANDNVSNGVVVHLAREADPGRSLLLDMTPASSTIWDWGDPALTSGTSFVDPDAGVTLSLEWADGGAAGVLVTFAKPACEHASPTVALSPSDGPPVLPGTSMTYAAEVSNADGAGCDASAFELGASIPEGWTAVYQTETLLLEPGASASTSLHVRSSLSAPDGAHLLEAIAQSRSHSGATGSATALYTVAGAADNAAPVAIDDSAETSQRTAVRIDVLSNDSDPDQDRLTITAVTQGSRGSVSIDASGAVVYTPSGNAKGEDTFTYTCSDSHQSATAAVHVSIQRGDNGGSGGRGGGKGKVK